MREETLTYHYSKIAELVALSDQIRMNYDTRHSIAAAAGGIKNQPGTLSPVERALHRIDAQREHLAEQMAQYFREEEEITQWLESVQDPITRTIVRIRFLNGGSWEDVSRAVYGRSGHGDSLRVYWRRQRSKIFED